MLSGLENTQNNENKKITKTPDFNLSNPKGLISDYKNYYEKNFGLRTTLINTYLNFKTETLKDNPLPDQVVKGEDEWYFLGNSYSDILNDTFGNVPFTDADLNAITQNLEQVKHYLNSKQVEFYVVVPPNKHTVYKEKLPFKLKQHINRLGQLQQHLKIHSSLRIISPQPRLMSQKDHIPLFHKTDTHWNDYGAFLGYSETMDVIGKDFNIDPILLSNYHVIEKFFTGDIMPMINKNRKEKSLALKKIKISEIDTLSAAYTFQHYKNKTENLKLIMHCDSFSDAWIPFFNESFGETVYIRKYELDYALIERIQPDIVIFEIVERNLVTLINKKNL